MASKLRVNQIQPVNGIPTGGGGGIIQMKFASFTGTQTFTSESRHKSLIIYTGSGQKRENY